MKSYYQMTALEKWTEDFYERLDIREPSQISIEYISERLNIWVHYLDVRSKGIEASAGMYSMYIDNRLSAEMQRLDFLHELCHLLRHSGNQSIMPEHYTQEQEDEADRFILYAAMPYSMISRGTLPELRSEAIHFLTIGFKVPRELAMQRADQIQRRIFQGQLLAVMGSQGDRMPSL